MQFGELLKSYRVSRGMRSRAKFAKEVGVSTEAMRLVEAGRSLPRVDTLRSILLLLALEEWEANKLMMCWMNGRMRVVASEVPTVVRNTFVQRFCELFQGHLKAALEEELPPDDLEELIESLLTAAAAVLDDLLGLSDPEETIEP